MRVLLLAGLVAAFSTSPAMAATTDPSNPPDPSINSGAAQRQLNAARAIWRRDGIRSYRFEAQALCFCRDLSWHLKIVRGGRSEQPRDDPLATVPRMFRLIQQAIDGRYHQLRVSYGAHGVPRHYVEDPDIRVADEQLSFNVRRFSPLARTEEEMAPSTSRTAR